MESFVQQDLFCPGEYGYYLFRIPAIIVTRAGNLLAFCEGRKNDHFDAGQIDLCMKRSFDLGQTWEPVRVIASDGRNTMGNPCPLVDHETGTVWMAFCHNYREDRSKAILDRMGRGTRTVWLMRSDDEGANWSAPVDMTGVAKKPDWTWYSTGPGIGVQLRNGRMIVPCSHAIVGSKLHRSHILFSDDHGVTWNLGGSVGPGCSESQAVELADGTLLLNMRDEMQPNALAAGEISMDERNHPVLPNGGRNLCRAVAVSHDGGMTWSSKQCAAGLTEPVCQASILRYDTEMSGGQDSIILFSNPAGLATREVSGGYPAGREREQMTVRLSCDGCRTWPVAKTIFHGPSAYSCLVGIPDGRIGCFYEAEPPTSGQGRLVLAAFTLDWLTGGSNRVN